MWRCVAIAVVLLAVLAGYAVNNILESMSYDKVITFSPPDSCQLVDLPTPVEDLSDYNGYSVFGGGGDIMVAFEKGSASAVDGAVWLIDQTGVVQQVSISGESAPSKLVLHGIHYSKRSKRLYAVNHDENVGESVEVFDVKEGSGVPQLVHRLTVRSPLFGNFALNDVVEGDGDEIYITEWRPSPFPFGGKDGRKNADLMTRLKFSLFAPISVFRIPLTRVFRCSISASPQCTIASEQRFVGANGIAISADRQTIYVNDVVKQRVSVMKRQSDGSLRESWHFRTKHVIDNLEMTEEGRLHAGTVPLPYAAHTVCEEAKVLSATKVVDGRTVGCGSSPGGLLDMNPVQTGGSNMQTDTVMHDGSKLSGVSSALKIGDKVVIGSPDSKGILFCNA